MTPTPIFFSGKTHRQWSLACYSPWGCTESDTTEHLSMCISIFFFILCFFFLLECVFLFLFSFFKNFILFLNFILLHYSLLQDIEYCSFATTVGSPLFIGVYLLIPSPNLPIPLKLW